MKKAIILSISTLFLSMCLMTIDSNAQRSFIRSKIRNKIEEDQANKQKERGREELKKVSYENDPRYPDPENRVEASIEMEMKSYNKKGQEDKNPMRSILVFGKNGESFVMNSGTKDEMWIIFNYSDKANYLVNIQQKTATKMPLVNLKKMLTKAAKNASVDDSKDGKWEMTNEKKTINGYHCQKYIFTDSDGNKMDSWVTKDISLDLSDNYILGSRIKDYANEKDAAKTANQNYPRGMMVRNIMYDKKTGNPTSQTDILSFKKSSDPKYFDVSKFKVNDVLDIF